MTPGLDGDVLVVLAGTTLPLTGRQIAGLVQHGSVDGVRKALGRLVEQGIVRREPAGRAFLYTLNREHVAAGAVEQLAALRSSLLARLRDAFGAWVVPPVHASLFGSAARADGDMHSDIDLFVVRPAGVAEDDAVWCEQLSELGGRVHAWTGNDAGIVEQGEADLERQQQSGAPVLSELRSDGIELAGVPLRRLLRAAA